MNKTSVLVLKSYLDYELNWNLLKKKNEERKYCFAMSQLCKQKYSHFFLIITGKKKILKHDVKKGMEKNEKQSQDVWVTVMNPRGSWAES